MVAVRWSNGKIDRADTWEALLDYVRVTQWAEEPLTDDEFRAVLVTRAYRWSLLKIDADLPAEFLFHALAEAHLVEIVKDDQGAPGAPSRV